jgi:ParB family transcriptional regulator, chromosome partitioning protein
MNRKRAQVTDANAEATLGAGGILARIGVEMPETSPLEVHEVAIELVRPNPFQPRQVMDSEGLAELATSIREHGFFGHLLVREDGRWYQLAYGERRLRAAQLAGLKVVPIQVRPLTDEQMLEISITENVQREDLNPVDEAQAYARLQEMLGYTVREISDKIGKSKSYVATLLSILRHAEVADAVRNADIPVRTAEELTKIEDAEERRRLLDQVLAGNLDREGIIEARRKRTGRTSLVRNADNLRPVPAISRALRALDGQSVEEITPSERQKAVTLLNQLIQRATALLGELES